MLSTLYFTINRPAIIKFQVEGSDSSITLNKNDLNNLLNKKEIIKPQNMLFSNNESEESLLKSSETNNSQHMLNGSFSDGIHTWKCSIILHDLIMTFKYPITSQNFRKNEVVNLIPKYDGGYCKFTIEPELPNGLFIEEDNGIISGTCLSESNTTEYTITCRNNSSQNTFKLTLSIGVLTKFIYPKDDALVGLNSEFMLIPEYDGDNCKFSCNKDLPDGLYLDTNTGIISGKANKTQKSTKYKITCVNNTAKIKYELMLTVISLTQFKYNLKNNTRKFTFNEVVKLKPTFDSPNCTFTIDKQLPNGLEFDTNTGVIAGKCIELAKQQEYVIICNNGFSTLENTLKLSVGDLTTFTYPNYLIKAKKGENIKLIPDFDGENCTFSILNDVLFDGLQLNRTSGIISGKCDNICKSKVFTIICSNSTALLDYKVTISIGELSLFKYEKNIIEINKSEIIHLIPQYEGDDCEFTINQKLPFGLKLNNKTGEISGKCKTETEKKDYIITCNNGIDKIDFTLQITVSSISFVEYEKTEFFLHKNEQCLFKPTHDGFNCRFLSDPEKLPDGLTLDEETGIISGICKTAQESKEYVICCENDYDSEICIINISVGVLTYFSYEKYDIYLNCSEDIEMIPVCNGDECEFTVQPELPNGITINKENGIITGKSDNVQCKKKYTVKCIDLINSSRQMTYEIYLTIGEITSFLYPHYDFHFSTDDNNINIIPKEIIGSKCIFYSVPNLPNGLTINNENGIISGECHDRIKDVLYTIICKNDISQKDYGIHITTIKPITYFRYTDDKYRYYGRLNDELSIEAEYDGSECKFYIDDGKLPAGLVLDESNGTVSGKYEEIVDDLRCKIICENEFSKRDYVLEFDVSSDCIILPSS